jgi:hypothetical protein
MVLRSLLPVKLGDGDGSDAKGDDDDIRNDPDEIDDDTKIRCSRQEQTNGRQGEQRGKVDAEEISTLRMEVSICYLSYKDSSSRV